MSPLGSRCLIATFHAACCRWLREFAELKLKSPLKDATFVTDVRADQCGDEVVALLKQAGCVEVTASLETVDASILDAVGRGMSVSRWLDGHNRFREAGISVQVPFLFNLSDDEDPEAAAKFVLEHDIDARAVKKIVCLGDIVGYGPNPESQCFNFGIELLAWARGHGYGTEAQRLLADWLFASSEVNRVEASTDIDNLPEQRSLEKAGFVRDGVMRGSQFRAGAYHDMITYSRIRSDR